MKTTLHLARFPVLILLGTGLVAASAVGVPANLHDHCKVIENRAASPATLRNAPLPASTVALLKSVAIATADGAAVLAADDLAGYKKTLPSLRTALVAFFDGYADAELGPLADYRKGLADPADLTIARRQFEPFSTAVADLAQGAGLHESEKLHVFQCSMSPVLGQARWLQRNRGTKNPFFGSRMLACGNEIAGPAVMTAETAITLPPGHPSLDAITMTAFARRRSEAPAPSEGACGNCGMSKAAMAAGEPCGDRDKQ